MGQCLILDDPWLSLNGDENPENPEIKINVEIGVKARSHTKHMLANTELMELTT